MIHTSDASNIVCGHCGGLVKGSCCWMAGKAYHNSCYSLLMGIERGLASVIDKDARIAALEAERDQLRAELAECKRDKHAALEALSDMVCQFFMEDGGLLHHRFMSAEEHAIGVLIAQGRAEEVRRSRYRLIDAAMAGGET